MVRVFHKVGEIGNITIKDFTMRKQTIPATKCYPNEDGTWDLCHSGLMLSSLS